MCFRLVRNDFAGNFAETRDVSNGIREGPRERESERAYVRNMTCAGCVGSSGRDGR